MKLGILALPFVSGLLLVTGVFIATARSLPAPPREDGSSYADKLHANQATLRGLGVEDCIGCHQAGNKFGGLEQTQINQWRGKQDGGRHSVAYRTLTSSWSDQIAGVLNSTDKLGSKATSRSDCLSCHSFDFNTEYGISPGDTAGLDKARNRQRMLEVDGVSCEACHGRAEKWVRDHVPASWKDADSGKWLEAGMLDTRNLVQWAAKCNECHVGNEEKVMTHTLLGAGHPDISSYELSSYLEYVPAHWRQESVPNHGVDGDWTPVRVWAVGQIVTLRDNVRRVGQWAKGWSEGTDPEFSLYECYSCHQSLMPSSPTWKAHRVRMAPPGEPVWNASAYAMVRQIIRQVSPTKLEAWENDVANLMSGVSVRRPDPGKAQTAARSLEVLANELVERLSPSHNEYARAVDVRGRGFVGRILSGIADESVLLISIGPRAAEQAYKAMKALYLHSWARSAERPANHDAIKVAIDELGRILLSGQDDSSGNRDAWKLNETMFHGTEFLEQMSKLKGLLTVAQG